MKPGSFNYQFLELLIGLTRFDKYHSACVWVNLSIGWAKFRVNDILIRFKWIWIDFGLNDIWTNKLVLPKETTNLGEILGCIQFD